MRCFTGDAALGVGEDVLGLRRGGGLVDRHDHRSDADCGEIHDGPRGLVPGEDRDAVAVLDAEADQGAGHAIDAFGEFGVGQGVPGTVETLTDGRPVRMAVHAVTEKGSQMCVHETPRGCGRVDQASQVLRRSGHGEQKEPGHGTLGCDRRQRGRCR